MEHELDIRVFAPDDEMPDLAPGIARQRLVVEGLTHQRIDDGDISRYLKELGTKCDMSVLVDPVTHQSPLYGWAGWVHWETSGAHFYAWDDPGFFSVDVYTCKQFDPDMVVLFTARFFDAYQVVAREF